MNITAFDFSQPGETISVPCPDVPHSSVPPVHDDDVTPMFPVLPKSSLPQDNQDLQDHAQDPSADVDADTIHRLQTLVDATPAISCRPKKRGQYL